MEKNNLQKFKEVLEKSAYDETRSVDFPLFWDFPKARTLENISDRDGVTIYCRKLNFLWASGTVKNVLQIPLLILSKFKRTNFYFHPKSYKKRDFRGRKFT